MSYKKLTPTRAKILIRWLAAIEANVESGEGDFYAGLRSAVMRTYTPRSKYYRI